MGLVLRDEREALVVVSGSIARTGIAEKLVPPCHGKEAQKETDVSIPSEVREGPNSAQRGPALSPMTLLASHLSDHHSCLLGRKHIQPLGFQGIFPLAHRGPSRWPSSTPNCNTSIAGNHTSQLRGHR